MASTDERRQELARLYRDMTEAELQEFVREADSLTDIAREALDAELLRRGLELEYFDTQKPKIVLDPKEVVTLRIFRDLPGAMLAKAALDSAGIDGALLDQNLIRQDWFLSNAIGGIKLQVRAEDATAAAEVLAGNIPEKIAVEGLGEFQQPRCPQCQSLDITFEGWNTGVALTSAFFLGVPIPLRRNRWKCLSCGHVWRDSEAPAS